MDREYRLFEEYLSTQFDEDGNEWPIPNSHGPSDDPALQPLGEAAWCDGIMISRLLRLLRLAAGNDDYDYDEGRYLFFDSLLNQGRRTSSYRRRPGLSPSMQHLVFWPHAGVWGAGVILPPCAQFLWCELYVMKIIQKRK